MEDIQVNIPTPLRRYTGGEKKLKINGATVNEVLSNLVAKYPTLEKHLFKDGELRSYVNIYVNDDDIRHLQKTQTRIRSGDSISIVPSIAGGTPSV